jgi:alpha-mannosidase
MRLDVTFLVALALESALGALQAAEDSSTPAAADLPSKAEAANTAPAPKAGLQTVIIVYKTHFDIGYTTMAREVVHGYRTEMADRVLDAIERNRNQPKEQQFVWTVSGWPMKQILWEGQSPERRQKLEQAIRDGNLAVHAYPFTTHTETAEPEDLVRGLNISSTLARQFGLPLSTGAKMSDVPGQSWVLPTLFAHAGIKFYHMGGPVVNMSFDLPPMFWWEGPDGSRLLTLYNNGYGSSPMPPAGWPYRTWIYISMTGDNQGPPDPGTVKRDIESYRSRGIEARVGRLDDFAELILREDLSKLPVVRSDISDPWIHGMLSMPAACKLAHNVRPAIGAVDQLTTLERCWGVFRPDIRAAVAGAYEQSMRFSEHTWGLANQHYFKQAYGRAWDELWSQGLPPQYKVMEQSWKEKAGCVDEVQRLVAGPYSDAILSLSDHVNVPGGRIVVYNPLPWRRDGEVTLNVFHLPHGVSLKPVDGGPVIPLSPEGPAVEGPYRVIRFVAKDVPPLGYRTYVVSGEKPAPVELAADEKAGIMESPFFKAALDAKRGRIISLIDKRSGRELVDGAAPQGFGQYLYERFGYKELVEWTAKSLYPGYVAHKMMFSAYDMPQDAVYSSALPENMSLAMKKTPIDVTAVMTGTIPGPGRPQQVSIRLTLPAALPVADLEIGWQKQPDGWPEAGWICLPFRCGHPKFRLGRVGADLDPVKDITVENANYHLFWVHTGVAVYDGDNGAGVAICPQDSPLVSLGEPGEYKFHPRYEPKNPYVYVNLYNNHWRTNFASWIGDGGRMTSRVRLWAFDKFASEPALYSPAMEARVPLAAARSTAPPGKLPPAQAGIALSRKGVAVTAFGPNPDGAGTLLRVWEQGGVGGEITVNLPAGAPFKTAIPVTLRGEKTGEPIKIEEGKLTFSLRAYAPASYLLSE